MGTGNKSLLTITKGILGGVVAVAGFLPIYKVHSHNYYPGGVYAPNNFAGLKVIMGAVTACTGFYYACEKFETGLNYKQHLQDKLTNLDANAAHITYEKTLIPALTAPVQRTS